jgi:outer membrane protein
MVKFSALLLTCLSSMSIANAQTPANNLMPDGSRDLYVGLGVASHSRYEGGDDTRLSVLPVLQMQWSNGVFIAGMSAGLHMSGQPSQEFGPLLSIEGGRSVSGNSSGLACPRCDVNPGINGSLTNINVNKLDGMEDINPRVLLGGFYNQQLSSKWRLTNNLLGGAGNNRQGVRWNSDLRYAVTEFAPYHHLTLSIGLSLVNQAYNQAYFGVSRAESLRSLNRRYTPSGGVKDVHAQLQWNWALSSTWLLTSSLNLTRLNGSAANSPLVERANSVSVSSALAYRF